MSARKRWEQRQRAEARDAQALRDALVAGWAGGGQLEAKGVARPPQRVPAVPARVVARGRLSREDEARGLWLVVDERVATEKPDTDDEGSISPQVDESVHEVDVVRLARSPWGPR